MPRCSSTFLFRTIDKHHAGQSSFHDPSACVRPRRPNATAARHLPPLPLLLHHATTSVNALPSQQRSGESSTDVRHPPKDWGDAEEARIAFVSTHFVSISSRSAHRKSVCSPQSARTQRRPPCRSVVPPFHHSIALQAPLYGEHNALDWKTPVMRRNVRTDRNSLLLLLRRCHPPSPRHRLRPQRRESGCWDPASGCCWRRWRWCLFLYFGYSFCERLAKKMEKKGSC